MSGFTATLDDKALQEFLQRSADRFLNAVPAWEAIGEAMRTSVEENFERGGRPDPWQDLADSTKDRRREGSGSGPSYKILDDTGVLKGSITYDPYADRVEMGSALVYSAIHQFGGQAGRGKKTTIPERPYLLVQDEDWDEIEGTLLDFVTLTEGRQI